MRWMTSVCRLSKGLSTRMCVTRRAQISPDGQQDGLYVDIFPSWNHNMGRENFNATRWQLPEIKLRTALALNVRIEPTGAIGGRGTEGISRDTVPSCDNSRRAASSMPPALTFNAVENSRNCLPASSTPRKKTGTLKGKRSQRRRSAPALASISDLRC